MLIVIPPRFNILACRLYLQKLQCPHLKFPLGAPLLSQFCLGTEYLLWTSSVLSVGLRLKVTSGLWAVSSANFGSWRRMFQCLLMALRIASSLELNSKEKANLLSPSFLYFFALVNKLRLGIASAFFRAACISSFGYPRSKNRVASSCACCLNLMLSLFSLLSRRNWLKGTPVLTCGGWKLS
ncbi:hypothetical protein GDO81_029237 [Engystomops pustulosus]|uniref:Uncharacterized protein n=1 Tax=Engystomops pustulosus TaxID=76066 RepID=A0AAV6YMG5_ENGPU|nr:hypothetical protein GDO81_029237 [Engystomops pustulosus]